MRSFLQGITVLLVSTAALAVVGCAGTSRLVDRADGATASAPAPTPGPEAPRLVRKAVPTEWVATALPTTPPRTETTYAAASTSKGWDGCCGLPCESGCGTWHLRGVGGYQFTSGEDSGSSSAYFGADAGYTFPCCIGVDVFWRTWCSEFDRDIRVAGAVPFPGTDVGHFNMIGLKATFERSFGGSRLYGYGGIGPQFFWTDDYLDDDSGFGGFAELGLGYRLAKRWRLRVGVEVAGLYTDIGRTSPLDDGEERWLWVVSPVGQIQFDL